METLPFRDEMLEAIRAGRKSCTVRTRRFGEPGDRLETEAGVVELVSVERLRLADVRDRYWEQEGVSSPDDFERVWKEIHPRRGFDPEQKVWLHVFKPVTMDAS